MKHTTPFFSYYLCGIALCLLSIGALKSQASERHLWDEGWRFALQTAIDVR